MYYGRYPYTVSELEVYKEYKTIANNAIGHHTLVMVPTFNDGKKNIDFNPHFIDKEGPMSLKRIREAKSKKAGDNQPVPMAQRGASSIVVASTDNDGTNVNLNSFDLTPPDGNIGTEFPNP